MFTKFNYLLLIFFNLIFYFKLAVADSVFSKVNTQLSNIKIFDELNKKVEIKDIFKSDKNYLVNFWATWCQPCKKELPELEKIYLDFKNENLKIYIISIDQKNTEFHRSFLNKLNITNLKSFYDPKMNFFNNLKLRGVPTSILIRDSKIFGKKEGIIKYDEDLRKELKKFIN